MTVLVLYKMGIKEALALSVTRIILSGFMFGNLFGILYSLSGGLLSFLVMVLLKKSDRFSVAGVSIGGCLLYTSLEADNAGETEE